MYKYTDNIRDFYSFEELTEHIFDNIIYDDSEYFSIDIIADEIISEILVKEFLSTDFEIASIDFNNLDYQGDYIVSITSDMRLFCQPAFGRSGDRIYSEADITYIHEDVRSDVFGKIDADEIIIFGIE